MNLRISLIYIILLTIILSGCYERDFSTPAQPQIDEYRKAGQMCMIEVKDNETSQNKTPDIETPKIPEKQQEAVLPSTNMFSVLEGDIVFGNPDSKVILIEYSSPTCLHCAYFHKEILPNLQKKYIDSGKIAYLIRPFISNKQDLDAAILTRCAPKSDYLKMVTILYQKQDSWSYHSNYRQILQEIGGLGGISAENYEKCLQDEEISNYLINNSRAISHVPGFLGTPSFVVDGAFLENGYSQENLSDLIDKAIKKYAEEKPELPEQKNQ